MFITFGILVACNYLFLGDHLPVFSEKLTLSSFLLDCIGIGTRSLSGAQSWRALIGIGLIWPAILSLGILFMPESPRFVLPFPISILFDSISFSFPARWLAAHGRLKEAERSVARAHGIKKEDQSESKLVQGVVSEIANQIEVERRLASGWISCFKPANKTLYRTLLGMSLQSFQQLTGANYFFYYGATIFQSVGIQDSFVTQIILGAVNFVCTFGGLYIMERVSGLLFFMVCFFLKILFIIII